METSFAEIARDDLVALLEAGQPLVLATGRQLGRDRP